MTEDNTEAAPGYPLDQLKVLEFSRVLAGPFAARMVRELGDGVVQIEPHEGEGPRLSLEGLEDVADLVASRI